MTFDRANPDFWSSRTDRQSYALTRCSKKKIVKIIYQGDKIRIFLLLFQWQVKLGVKQCYDGVTSYSGGAIAAQDTWNMIMLWWNPMQLMNFHLGLYRGNSCVLRWKKHIIPSLCDSTLCCNAVGWRLVVRIPTLCRVAQTLIYVLEGEIGWERNLRRGMFRRAFNPDFSEKFISYWLPAGIKKRQRRLKLP